MLHCLLYIALVALLAHIATGQEVQHPLTNMPPKHEKITTHFLYPDHKDDIFKSRLPVNKPIKVLCHFENTNDYNASVTAIMGSLNSPNDFTYLANFSFKPYSFNVLSYEEVTLEYEFYIPYVGDGTFTIAHNIFYGVHDGERDLYYSENFFNQTINLYQVEEETNVWTILNIVKAIVSVFAVGYAVWFIFNVDDEKEVKKEKGNKK